jgi:hypothetical protein
MNVKITTLVDFVNELNKYGTDDIVVFDFIDSEEQEFYIYGIQKRDNFADIVLEPGNGVYDSIYTTSILKKDLKAIANSNGNMPIKLKYNDKEYDICISDEYGQTENKEIVLFFLDN